MTIYSIVPDELLYADIDKLPELQQLSWNGVMLQVEQLADAKARIVRIISSDPQLFLDARLQPGQVISLLSER